MIIKSLKDIQKIVTGRTVKFKSPLTINRGGKKDFILNLNKYRNTHHFYLANAKSNYTDHIKLQLVDNKIEFDKVMIHYVFHPGTNAKYDTANVIAVHAKFFCDAIQVKKKDTIIDLLSKGLIKDDDYKHLVFSSESFGGVDKADPRVDIYVTEVLGYDCD